MIRTVLDSVETLLLEATNRLDETREELSAYPYSVATIEVDKLTESLDALVRDVQSVQRNWRIQLED